jgi:GntR family transcriptional repressor for pyruvate dehydrogenase complex
MFNIPLFQYSMIPSKVMIFKKINKRLTSEQVIEQIISTIEAGRLKSSEQLPSEKDLAASFGVGRSSVREAIRTLVVMGYLEVFQGKGSFVKERLPVTNNIDDIMDKAIAAGAIFDLMETREIIECRSAELAATRADESQADKIKKAVQHLKKCRIDTQAYIEADWDFHMTIAEATNNSVIVDVMNLLINKIHRYNAEFLATSSEISNEAISSAEEIVSHILAGDGRKASTGMQHHLQLVNSEIEKMIKI